MSTLTFVTYLEKQTEIFQRDKQTEIMCLDLVAFG